MAAEDDWNEGDEWAEGADAADAPVEEDTSEGSYRKPSKASKETLKYLSDFVADADAPRVAAHNVARELKWEAASVAADKSGGALLEALARRCSTKVVARLAVWLAPFCGFLVYHRHGSHVLQTLLALLCNRGRGDGSRGGEEDDDDEGDDEDEDDDDCALAQPKAKPEAQNHHPTTQTHTQPHVHTATQRTQTRNTKHPTHNCIAARMMRIRIRSRWIMKPIDSIRITLRKWQTYCATHMYAK